MAPVSSRKKKGDCTQEKPVGRRDSKSAKASSAESGTGRRTRKAVTDQRDREKEDVRLADTHDADDVDNHVSKSRLRDRRGRGKNASISTPAPTSSLSNGEIKKKELDVGEKENDKSLIIRGSKEPVSPPITPRDLLSSNIVHRIYRHTTGQRFKQNLKQATIQPFVQQLSEFRVSHGASPFDRRVTAMEWHPTHPTMLAVGSKGGDLMLWDYSKGQDGWNVVQGIGPGGNIACLLFSRDKPDEIYSASLDGQVRLQNFEGRVLHLFQNTMDWRLASQIGKGGSVQALRHDLSDPSWIFTSSIDGMVSRLSFDGQPKKIYLNTNDWNHWYCSVDVNYTDNVLVAGDNTGNVVLMSRQGEKLWSHRLHKQKVTHCEFNHQCPWLLATASTDKTVKMWDIRNISGKTSYLYDMAHERPINSAYFSPDGTKLLTTDQHSHLRIYSGPLWDTLERTIIHPHRFFQHLTPIKATWHPFQNLIVVGRYPDATLEGFEHDTVRSIDAYDVSSGELVCRLMDQCASGIQSLNVFNPSGDALATGMGFNTLIWQNADIRAQVREEEREIMRRQGKEPPPDEGPSKKAPKRHRSNNQKLTEKLQTMKKVKTSR